MIKIFYWLGLVLLYLATILLSVQFMLFIKAPTWFQFLFFLIHGIVFGINLKQKKKL